MRRRTKVALLCVALALATVISLGLATAAPRHVAAAPPAFTAKQLGTPPGNDWITAGGDLQNDHYSTLKDINLSNVSGLKQAWHIHLGESARQQMEANGLIYQGTYYTVTGNGDVYALNASTGAQIWKYTAPSVGSTLVRGIAMGDGKIFYGEVDDYMVAIDASTGQLAWKSQQLADPKAGYSLNGAATYYNGMVYEGVSGSENGIRGFLAAWNAKTGKLMWKHYFIPAKGDPAYKSWGKSTDVEHGGAGVWTHPIVDAAKGIIYVGTANAAPYHQRPAGNDLYTSSDVALNAKTGKMLWYYQTVHHDDTDFDIANSPVLYDYSAGKGKVVHVLDQPTKMGFNFILNRYTGKPTIPTPETPQPQDPSRPDLAKTQPIPYGQPFTQPCATPQEWIAAGGTPTLLGPDGKPLIFGCNFSPILSTQYTVPGWHDNADWPTNAYSRAHNLFYVCSTANRGDAYEAVPIADFKPVPGSGSYTGNVSLLAGDWAQGKVGNVTAIDPRTNNIVWKATMPDGNACYSGLTTTAGDLVFVGTFDGHFLAYNAVNGNLVWESPQLDASVAASASVYKGSDGKEYVTLLVGGFTISGKAKLGDSVYAFALP